MNIRLRESSPLSPSRDGSEFTQPILHLFISTLYYIYTSCLFTPEENGRRKHASFQNNPPANYERRTATYSKISPLGRSLTISVFGIRMLRLPQNPFHLHSTCCFAYSTPESRENAENISEMLSAPCSELMNKMFHSKQSDCSLGSQLFGHA